jgi:hypothetical protein
VVLEVMSVEKLYEVVSHTSLYHHANVYHVFIGEVGEVAVKL